MVRHAESRNNQVYTDARFLFRGGTPDFDENGWKSYVEENRKADPDLSDIGYEQRQQLCDYMVPHLENQASLPVRVVVSPMKRTLLTIKPTLERLKGKCQIIVNGFYHESEGCHTHKLPEEGMTPAEIREMLKDCVDDPSEIQFEGFPDMERGWYVLGTGPETRAESEVRAAKFYTWLCEHLDQQLKSQDTDIFDAGVKVPGEEKECEHDKFAPRIRRRRKTLLIGHADFMSLVLKRVVAGFGHFVETDGVHHRSAFVHFNTGFTELEYFGEGRFLVMGSNQTPHIKLEDYSKLRSGGSLKDGWSYAMPNYNLLQSEVSVAFSDEEIDDHVKEQTEALKSLYLPSSTKKNLKNNLPVEELTDKNEKKVTFFVKRGLQVVGCAKLDEETFQVSDLIVRPSARNTQVGESLVNAVRSHAKKLGRSESLLFKTEEGNKEFLEEIGFSECDENASDVLQIEV